VVGCTLPAFCNDAGEARTRLLAPDTEAGAYAEATGKWAVVELPHTSGYCAVIGGYVYRGSAIADLGGSYLFGDSCRANLVAVAVSGGQVTLQRDLGVSVSSLTTFGEDPSGELYAAARTGTS
jgi:hypothetical protein